MSDSSKTINQIGQSGYYFFFGLVEDRNDPMKIGRIRVRTFQQTQDKALLPTAALPWAQIILPLTVNDSSTIDIQEGTVVHGFFLDGEDMQVPVITGHLPGMLIESNYRGYTDKTISGSADGRIRKSRNTLSGGKVKEPADPYAAQYPFNHCFETESGHIIEYDDTPGAERLNIQHKSGSYIQIDSSGNTVIRSNKLSNISENDHEVLCKNMTVHVSSELDITVIGDAKITVNGNSTETVSGNKKITASQVDITASGNVNIKGSNINLNS